MKKTIILICIVLIAVLLVGCEAREIVSTKPINTEYIAAYDAMETDYVYKYDFWNGEFKYLPEVKMVHHPEEWRVQYERVWSDGTKDTCWKTVSKSEYEKVLQEIENEQETDT